MAERLRVYAIAIVLLAVTITPYLTSCSPATPDNTPQAQTDNITPEEKTTVDIASLPWSQESRNRNEVPASLVDGNNKFTCDLYRELIKTEKGNFLYSPYSIYLALAMAYAGARGGTAEEMANKLHFTMPAEEVPVSFNNLNKIINNPGYTEVPTVLPDGSWDEDNLVKIDNYTLNIANALWGQEGYPFIQEYIELVNTYYGGGLKSLDFANKPEIACEEINKWVSEQTEDRINEVVSTNDINKQLRLIITNTIYFFSLWQDRFSKKDTVDRTFYFLDGTEAKAPAMYQHMQIGYTEGVGYKAVEISYLRRELSMIIILPDISKLSEFEKSLNSDTLKTIINNLDTRTVELQLPKFKYTSKYDDLSEELSEMGMSDAFASAADFSGISQVENLFISKASHKTFIMVDEEGTEAAACTNLFFVGSANYPPATFIADHPFIYFIQHASTGTILFMGRVTNPLSEQ
jgi:serpin B